MKLITYSVLDACRLIVAHERRHLTQAKRVMETLASAVNLGEHSEGIESTKIACNRLRALFFVVGLFMNEVKELNTTISAQNKSGFWADAARGRRRQRAGFH
jgi:hypothetical protein